ncbi:MAG: glycosyltransferase family 39 protein [Polyangia bacterium]
MSHRLRGIGIAIIAATALAVLMFFPRVLSFGVGLGVVLTALVAIGLLDAIGAWKIVNRETPAPPDPVDLDGASRWLRIVAGFEPRLLWLALALVVAGACRLSVIGTLGAAAPWSGPALIAAGLVAAAIARKARPRPFRGELHLGMLVLLVYSAAVVAALGSHGLWDCWETHYGEVARRQLEQDDWISLWWQDKWFYSKPILLFWLMNLGMALFAVNVAPDAVSAHAEWGVRFFVAAIAVAAVWAVYQLIARRISRRAGLITAAVLASTPLWAFMARQALTDMPFVGLMTIAAALFLLGITADPEKRVEPVRIPLGRRRALELSGFHAVIAGYVGVALPQHIYLATRSHWFRKGTVGWGDLDTVASKHSFFDVHLSDAVGSLAGFEIGGAVDLSLDWLLLGICFAALLFLVLISLRRERRVSRLCFHGMYLALALSVMAKGLPGLAMPMLGLFGLWLAAAPFGLLTETSGLRRLLAWHWEKLRRLDLCRGLAMLVLVAAPWFVAMLVRHGDRFIDRFFIHDHIKRLSVGVHGDTGTIEYYIQQLGYAAIPWVALLPLALVAWLRWRNRLRSDPPGDPAHRNLAVIRVFVTSWGVLSFFLLSMMVTKFHHYTFPLMPPVAIAVGLLLDDIWSGREKRIGAVVVVGVAILAAVARDLVVAPPEGEGIGSGFAQLVGLFIYKYSRPYPTGEEHDFGLALLVFLSAFGLSLLAWLWRRGRRGAIVLTLLLALVFEHWLVHHYMIRIAPHWTQKHLIEEYYARRSSPAEKLVAFQMNWKGENFYTGNRLEVYVSTRNKQFEKWVERHRGERHFFITEHHRYERMSRRADAASGPLEPLPDLCNKYRAGVADEL